MASLGKVLMIEDNLDQAYLYQTAFRLQDVDVSVANSGSLGLEIARNDKPAVIILDIIMEGMNGQEVLRRLKNDDTTKKIPVLVLTNLDKEAGESEMKILGAEKYWSKTEVTPAELVVRVKAYLSGT